MTLPSLLTNRKVLVAVSAILTIYIVKLTGLDAGLVDQLLGAIVDALSTPEAAPVEVAPEELGG
jgi:hypothetical protein